MKNYSEPPFVLHETGCALNAAIKAINEPTIIPLDFSNGVNIVAVANQANVVSRFLKIQPRASYDFGWTSVAVQDIFNDILFKGLISEIDLENMINSEIESFMNSVKARRS